VGMYGAKKDISKFRAFGCQAYIYLDSERRANGKHFPRAIEAINLGFAMDHNISGYKLFILATLKIMVSNQMRFDKLKFPYRKQEIDNQSEQDRPIF
jgi:hypothetical protein